MIKPLRTLRRMSQATALQEYQNELVRFLQPLITEGLQSIYKSAQEFCEKNDVEHEVLSQFQRGLKQIPRWAQMIVEEETSRIVKVVPCLSNLMKLIFVTKVEILSNLNKYDDDEYIKVRIPQLCVFLHKIYSHAARLCFAEPDLFYHKNSLRERERNLKYVYKFIREAILQTIHELFFLGDILQDPLVKQKTELSVEKHLLQDQGVSVPAQGSPTSEYPEEKDNIEEEYFPPVPRQVSKRNSFSMSRSPPNNEQSLKQDQDLFFNRSNSHQNYRDSYDSFQSHASFRGDDDEESVRTNTDQFFSYDPENFQRMSQQVKPVQSPENVPETKPPRGTQFEFDMSKIAERPEDTESQSSEKSTETQETNGTNQTNGTNGTNQTERTERTNTTQATGATGTTGESFKSNGTFRRLMEQRASNSN